MLGTLTGSIWEELGTSGSRPQPINSFRRNLQRIYAEEVMQLLLDAPPTYAYGPSGRMRVPVPEHARSLARMKLHRLSHRIGEILDAEAAPDLDTRAHLAESKARIDKVLVISLSLPVEGSERVRAFFRKDPALLLHL